MYFQVHTLKCILLTLKLSNNHFKYNNNFYYHLKKYRFFLNIYRFKNEVLRLHIPFLIIKPSDQTQKRLGERASFTLAFRFSPRWFPASQIA